MTKSEAAQIASLLNARNQLTLEYDVRRVLASAAQYLYRVIDGRVIAAVELKHVQWYQAEVCHLTVDEQFEGKGYARGLLSEVEQRAAAQGFRLLQCTIREGNQASEGLFGSAGFAKASRFNNPVSGNNIAVWQKVLIPAV